ncbi:MAG: vanadium-dependent haloperoxidase [Saprospiraceae bacterium]|nr:vanadium-dependent haloperoxidase [Saprospiraceae bacterium]
MKLKNLFLPFLGGLLLLSVFVTSCGKDDDTPVQTQLVADFSAEASLEWNQTFHEVERYAAGYRPGPAPRALALMGLGAYEACITGMPDYNSMESRYTSSGLDIPDVQPGAEYHWPTVVHGVYANMMPKFFVDVPADAQAKITARIAELDSKFLAATNQELFDRSKAYGESVGEAMWAWSKTDTYGDNAYKNPFGNFNTNEEYDWAAHYTGPGDWEPTTPGPGKGMGPYYGKARTFVITESQKLSRPPLAHSDDPTSALYGQAIQVYAQNTPTLSHEAEWIGEFWSDDLINVTFSPGPRWTAIANQIIESHDTDLETALEAYAKCGMALSDAAVACWHSKYYYNFERPETYIKRVIDPNWEPALTDPISGASGMTPSFPAYPSGHSTMGGAGAATLASVFGYGLALTDRCHEGRTDFEGAPRSFNSLYEMAYENAWSRIPLGVHFWMDCEEGLRLGTFIGEEVNKLPWKK